MARGLWKGAISFGLVNVPVELFSAERRSSELDLTMLDKRDLAPVGYKRYNKSTGEDVPWAEIVKGYEYDDDKYVVLSDEDFRRANVEASKTVDIQAFVDLKDIPPLYFETPYYLAPGKRGEKAYALLRDAMKKAGKAGIATVVIRTRQYLAAVMPAGRRAAHGHAALRRRDQGPEELGVPSGALPPQGERQGVDMALRPDRRHVREVAAGEVQGHLSRRPHGAHQGEDQAGPDRGDHRAREGREGAGARRRDRPDGASQEERRPGNRKNQSAGPRARRSARAA
jgi:hypothetical protein